ncbi:MAG: prolyl oligopeptidase family serine peptidase [Rhizomicrobium sp.]
MVTGHAPEVTTLRDTGLERMAPAGGRRMLRVAVAIAVLVLGGPAAADASPRRPVTLDDLDGVASGEASMLATLDLSADGKSLAVERGGELSVVRVEDGRILQRLGEGLIPRWSPDGERLAFYSRRSGTLQLWLWNRSDGGVQQLTQFTAGVDPEIETRMMGYVGDAFRMRWSPDGRDIVLASRVASLAPVPSAAGAPLVLDNTTPPGRILSDVFAHPGGGTGGIVEARDGRDVGFRSPRPGEALYSQLFIVDVDSHRSRQITHDSAMAFDPAWSPDGRTIAFARIRSDDPGAAAGGGIISATKGEIMLLDLRSGNVRTLAVGNGVKYRPLWSSDGARIAFLVSSRFDGPAAIRVVPLDGVDSAREYRLNGPVVNYDWDRSAGRDGFLVSYDSGSGRGSARGTPVAHVRDTNFLGARTSAPVGPWSQARSGAVAWVEGEAGPVVWLSSDGGTTAERLLSLTSGGDLELARSETVTWRNGHHEMLAGDLLYPAHYVPGTRYPLIVDVYPFPGGGGGWMSPLAGNQAWASAGYMVFKPRPRAPHSAPNCSGARAFCKRGEGPAAWDTTVDDVMSGVADLERRGLVDPERMCLYGHSNGGGVVDYLVTRTDRFKCAVSVAPALPDWIGTSLLWFDGLGFMADLAGAKLWEDPSAYVKLSAVFRAGKVKTPMLLADGDEDGNFLLGSIELYNVLRAAGANVTLLRYPGQGHVLTGAALRDFWRRETDFFAIHLQPEKTDR